MMSFMTSVKIWYSNCALSCSVMYLWFFVVIAFDTLVLDMLLQVATFLR